MANVQLAVAGDETTQVILSVPGVQGPAGSNLPPSGTTNQVLYKQSSTDYDTAWSLVTSAMITDGTIVNGDINASAAIAGTKISPDFGSQNVVTTGTATAASFIPTSSGVPANGLYLPSANNVAISTGGSGRLFVDASGNVGIGAAPGTSFHITRSTSDAVVRIDGGSANTSFTDYQIAGSNKAYVGLGGLSGGSNDDLINYNSSAGNWIAYTNSSERLRITSTGTVNIKGAGTAGSTQAVSFNGSAPVDSLVLTSGGLLGIGTTSPSTTFVVSASSTAGMEVTPGSASASSGTLIEHYNRNTAAYTQVRTIALEHVFSYSSGDAARIDSSGRLLVGTSFSPGSGAGQYARLVVQGYTGAATEDGALSIQRGEAAANITSGENIGKISFNDSAGFAFADIAVQADADAGAGDYPGRLVFSTTADGASSPTEQLRITSDRYVRLASGSGGIQFNGDTAEANALDDYEEGTWTPSISGLTGFDTPSGTYTKIGRMVYCSFWVNGTFNAAYTITDPIITSLPFTAGASQAIAGSAVVLRLDSQALIVNPTAIAGNGEVRIVMSNSGTNNPTRGFGGQFAYRV